MAEIQLRLRGREVSRTPIVNTRITMGRDASSDVVIDNPAVSRTHAILIYVDNKFRIRDADSENGLTVNGTAVKDAVLNYGDVIGLGKFELVLLDTGEALNLKAGAQRKPKAKPQDVVETFEVEQDEAALARAEVLAIQAAGNARKKPAAAVDAKPPPRASEPRASAPLAVGAKKGPDTIPVLDAPPEPEAPSKVVAKAPTNPQVAPVAPPVFTQSRIVTEAIAILKVVAVLLVVLLLSLGGVFWYLERNRPDPGHIGRGTNEGADRAYAESARVNARAHRT